MLVDAELEYDLLFFYSQPNDETTRDVNALRTF